MGVSILPPTSGSARIDGFDCFRDRVQVMSIAAHMVYNTVIVPLMWQGS
jgi:ABC-type multidrug transport system ATPase subunit